MAGTSKANLLQTAYNVAATVVSAEVQAGAADGDILARLDEVKATVFNDLVEVYASEPQASSAPKKSWGGGGGGGGGSISAEDAASTVIKHGKFDGITLGTLLDMSGEECASYGYGEGDKTGKQYVEWLSRNDKNPFMQRRAKVLLGQ